MDFRAKDGIFVRLDDAGSQLGMALLKFPPSQMTPFAKQNLEKYDSLRPPRSNPTSPRSKPGSPRRANTNGTSTDGNTSPREDGQPSPRSANGRQPSPRGKPNNGQATEQRNSPRKNQSPRNPNNERSPRNNNNNKSSGNCQTGKTRTSQTKSPRGDLSPPSIRTTKPTSPPKDRDFPKVPTLNIEFSSKSTTPPVSELGGGR